MGIGLKMMNHMLAQPLAAVWDAHKYWASFSIKPPRQNSWVDFGCGAVSCFPETLCGGRGGKFFDGEKPSTGSSSLFDVNREEEPVLANSFHP